MKKESGFTFVAVMSGIAIIGIVMIAVFADLLNNRGATERRALDGANKFLIENSIKAKRVTCAGDSDNDGYGTCNIVTESGEKIILSCPTNYVDVNWFGATGCKEVFQNMNFTIGNGG